MKRIISAAMAAGLVGAISLSAAAPANAQSVTVQFGQQDRYISERCREHPNWRGCDDWRDNRRHWSRSDYRNWYRWNEPNLGRVAAGIFGFAVGSAIANGVNNARNSDWDEHVEACYDRYRSYSAETDTFLGYDGRYHRCTL